jgi:osmotically-inducible protein OsmY
MLAKLTNTLRAVVIVAFFGGGLAIAVPQQPSATEPDNTRVNKRDRNANEPTADQQKNNVSDRDMTKQIRQSITSDKSLSTNAHNVKVITQNGTVTLKGVVRSAEEKQAVESKAASVAGSNIVNQLEVKPEK